MEMKHYLQEKSSKAFVAAATLILIATGAGFSPALAGDDDPQRKNHNEGTGHSHNKAGGHGGQVTMTKEFHFEVVFERRAVNVFLYNAKQNPISAKSVTGTVSFSFRDKDRQPVDAELSYGNPAGEHDGNPSHEGEHTRGQDFLRADVDLSEVQEGEMKAVFALKGLPGENEKEITLKEAFKLARIVTYECPMSCMAPTDEPGNCEKCGMTMKRTETIYACSMHPNVTSQNPEDKCWVCGMKVTLVGGDAEPEGDHGKSSDHKH
jgi:hypothetical protein